jgi:hypothetical protein
MNIEQYIEYLKLIMDEKDLHFTFVIEQQRQPKG